MHRSLSALFVEKRRSCVTHANWHYSNLLGAKIATQMHDLCALLKAIPERGSFAAFGLSDKSIDFIALRKRIKT